MYPNNNNNNKNNNNNNNKKIKSKMEGDRRESVDSVERGDFYNFFSLFVFFFRFTEI